MPAEPNIEMTNRVLLENAPNKNATGRESRRILRIIDAAEAVRKERGWRGARELLARRLGLKKEDTVRTAESNFPKEYNRKKTPPKLERSKDDQGRIDAIGKVFDKASNFAEKGFDGLSAGEQHALVNQILPNLDKILLPETVRRIDELGWNNDQKREFLRGILRNPRYSEHIIGRLEELSQIKVEPIDSELKDRFSEKEEDYQKKKLEKDRLDREFAEAERDREKWIDAAGAAGPQQTLLEGKIAGTGNNDSRNDLLGRQAQLRADVQQQERIVAQAKTVYDTAVAGSMRNPNIDTQGPLGAYQNAMQALDQPKQDLVQVEKLLKDITDLEEEKEKALRKYSETKSAKDNADIEFNSAEGSYYSAKADLDMAKIDRQKQLDEYYRGYERIWEYAGAKTMEEEYEAIEEAANKVYDEMVKGLSDYDRDAFRDALRDMFNRDVENFWGTRRRSVPDADRISYHWDQVFTNNEYPRHLVEESLRHAVDPEGRRLYTDAEIRDKLANGETARTLERGAMLTLIQKRMQTGKITGDEAEYIAGTTWGEGILDEARAELQKSEAGRRQLNEWGIEHGSVSEGIRKLIRERGNWLAVLLALLGIGGATAVAGPVGFAGASAAVATGVAGVSFKDYSEA